MDISNDQITRKSTVVKVSQKDEASNVIVEQAVDDEAGSKTAQEGPAATDREDVGMISSRCASDLDTDLKES